MNEDKIKNEIFDIAFNGLSDIEKDIITHPVNNWRRRHKRKTIPRKLIKKIQRKMYRKNALNIFNYLDSVVTEQIENNLMKGD